MQDDVRESMNDCVAEWEGAIDGHEFHGGDAPDLADLVYCLHLTLDNCTVTQIAI